MTAGDALPQMWCASFLFYDLYSSCPQAFFMLGMSRSMLGLESLALMLSLPFALLIWACVSGYIT